MRTPFLGIGTGRCGTNSLSRIVGACSNTCVTHEKYGLFWYEITSDIGDLIRDMRASSKSGVLWGEVGQAVGPHVENIRSSVRGTKVVCLHRDKQETVQSFMDFKSYLIRPSDKRHWAERSSMDNMSDRALFHKRFPLIDAWTVSQSYEFYWEVYEKLMEKIRDPVLHMNVEELNSDNRLVELFDFLEIPEVDRVFVKKRRYFTSVDVRRLQRDPQSRDRERESVRAKKDWLSERNDIRS